MSTVGKRIHDRRISLGLSADELAARLGKNRATIYRYESDEIENLPITIIGPLAAALETTPSFIMGWDDGKALQDNKKTPTLVIEDERTIEFIKLFSQLTPAEQDIFLAQIKGVLSSR